MSGNQLINGLKGKLLKLAQPELSKLHNFKDIHKGEDSYLFGSGASLKWFDLQEFSSKVSIAIPFLPFHRSFSVLNVKYVMPIEPFWFYPGWFTKYVTKLRKSFSDLLFSLLRTQLLAKGIIDKGEWNVYQENITFIFEDDGYFSELKKLEIMKDRIEMIDTISSGDMIGRYYSIDWVRKNVLMHTDDDIELLNKQMADEKAAVGKDEDGESDDTY